MVSAQVRREQTRFAMKRGLSQRRACALLQVGRSCMNYEAKMPTKNAPVIEAMRTLSGQYPRFGSRRIRVMLAREGIVVGRSLLQATQCRAAAQFLCPTHRCLHQRIAA